INPIDLVIKYGADATRFGLLWQAGEGQDMRFGEADILAGKKFSNKIWNASRFVFGMIDENTVKEMPQNFSETDKEILEDLEKTVKIANESISKFRFDAAIQEIYHFFWHKFCDKYIEEAKERIKNPKSEEDKKTAQFVLWKVLLDSLKLLHPFIPFVTETIYQKMPGRPGRALIAEKWPE
ncbi:MAG: class I tRNA ligase family protein, partial [Candidatus Portnoybacteria bacterium]|nr:class I tRNA ligase family protein [Candidatus Portnoybacteria bacterium]